jgi:hypothetical protein
MPKPSKIDNHNLVGKLALRQHFLRKYHAAGPCCVLDCCEGSGRLWRYLRRDFTCEVMGVDVKRAKGRLCVDSRRLLEADWLEWDVVDVDTYGSPWTHWSNLLESISKPCTVFLTWGKTGISGITIDRTMFEALGLTFPTLRVPGCLVTKIGASLPRRMLALAWDRGCRIVEAAEVPNPGGSARYFGVRLEPLTVETAGSSHRQAECPSPCGSPRSA